MGVQLFKTGSNGTISNVFNEHSFLHHLDNGWSLTPEKFVEEGPIDDEEDESFRGLEEDGVDEEDGPVDEDTPEEEIRLAAKAAGISNWHNKGIDRLKEELKDDRQSKD